MSFADTGAALVGLLEIAALWIALTLLPALVITSWATARFRDTSRLVALTLTLGLAIHLLPFLVFTVAAATVQPISRGLAALVALTLILALRSHLAPSLDLLRSVGRSLARPATIAPAHLALAAFALFAFGFQTLAFDTQQGFHFDCIYRPVVLAAGWGARGSADLANPSLWYADHQRLGVTEVLAPSMALFDFAGLRLQWGGLYAVLPLSVYVVARRQGIGRAGALVGAAVASGLPWLVGYADQNRVVLSTTAVLSLVLCLRTPAPFLVGALVGLLFSEEPVVLLGGLCVPLAMALGPDRRWRTLDASKRAVLGLLLAVAPALARYQLAFGRLFYHEHFSYMPSLPYSLAGVGFQLNAFLNWPLHDHLVRSPYNALPNLALLPLGLLTQLSLPLVALTFVGAVALVKQGRARSLVTIAAAFLPVAGFLAINENWVEREKGDIVTMVYVPLFLLIAAGGGALADPRSRRKALVGVALAMGLLVGAHAALNRIEAPEDTRLREAFAARTERLPPEDPDYLALERSRLARIAWLPPEHFFRHREPSLVWSANARAFLTQLRDRHVAHDRFQQRERNEDGGARDLYAGLPERVVRLDFAEPPSVGVTRGGARAVPPCPPGAPVNAIAAPQGRVRLNVPWSTTPVDVEVRVADLLPGVTVVLKRTDLLTRIDRDPPPLGTGTCVEVRAPDVPIVYFIDKLSFLPTREYLYRMPHDPARDDGALLESLDR